MSNNTTQEERIFQAALDCSSDAERAAFLDDACRDRPGLRARLELMLEGHFRAEKFLDDRPDLAHTAADEAVGSFIGRYKLLEKIGEGGFGVVFAAEQKEPVKRRVALKIIKLGMDTKQVVTRFEAERQALALMDHPNIAKVFDGGASESGRPYFVMELVRGVPITNYCDENNLSVHERLPLFMSVCQAVQHAHQKGIIHRDLKPSNILVTVNDGVAVTKVIDFGVAKATQQGLIERTIFTQFHHFIGTPAYMSPEQADMTSVDVDTRSDIYSLGVLLYELLTGKPPFDGKELLASGLDEMRRIIREKEPLKPSTRLSREREARNPVIPNPKSTIDSDLDWIVMRCLEKDRNRRYDTANGLAMDLARYLTDEPIAARPPRMTYRFRKLVHRNKIAFVATATVGLALLGGIGATSWQAIRAQRAEKAQARQRVLAERRLDATLRFIEEVFRDVSPRLQNLIGGTEANKHLNSAGLTVMNELREEAHPTSEFRRVLGQLYTQVGFAQGWFAGAAADYETGLQSAKNALELLRGSEPQPASDKTVNAFARAEMVAGYAALRLRRYEEALGHFREFKHWGQVMARSTNQNSSAEGVRFQEWATGSMGLALFHAGKVEEALTNHFLPFFNNLSARNISEKSAGRYDLHDLQRANAGLGRAFHQLQRGAEALPYVRESHRLAEVLAKRYPDKADVMMNLVEARARLGELLVALNHSDEGFTLLADSLKRIEELITRDPASVAFAELRIHVLRLHSLALSAWSRATDNPIERQNRIEQAHSHLRRAENLLAELPTESAKNWLRPDLDAARVALAEVRK